VSVVNLNDSDFRVCQVGFDVLLEIQSEAEERGLSARWNSVDALRAQVAEGAVLLRPLMREERAGAVRAYRCLVLFAIEGGKSSGGIATIDLDPVRFASLVRIDRDSDVRMALVRVFSLAVNGISMVSKE